MSYINIVLPALYGIGVVTITGISGIFGAAIGATVKKPKTGAVIGSLGAVFLITASADHQRLQTTTVPLSSEQLSVINKGIVGRDDLKNELTIATALYLGTAEESHRENLARFKKFTNDNPEAVKAAVIEGETLLQTPSTKSTPATLDQ